MFTHRIAVISLVLLVAGCHRSKNVSTTRGDVKIEESGSAGSKLPDDYPKDVPVASGAKIVMATSVNNADTKGSSIVLESAESFDKTVAFYKKGLADNGWKIDGTISGENTTMLTAAKDTRQLVVQIGESEGKCSV